MCPLLPLSLPLLPFPKDWCESSKIDNSTDLAISGSQKYTFPVPLALVDQAFGEFLASETRNYAYARMTQASDYSYAYFTCRRHLISIYTTFKFDRVFIWPCTLHQKKKWENGIVEGRGGPAVGWVKGKLLYGAIVAESPLDFYGFQTYTMLKSEYDKWEDFMSETNKVNMLRA